MYNEIYEEPEVLRRLILDRHNEEIRRVVRLINEAVSEGGDIFLVGSGSSYHSCIFARNLFALKNHFIIHAYPGSEFLNYVSSVDRRSLVIFVSQSGESEDEVEAFSHIKNYDLMTVAITNDADSTLAKLCREVLPINAGLERAIPATKTYLAELGVFFLLSEELASEYELEAEKEKVFSEMRTILDGEYQSKIRTAAKTIVKAKNIFCLGFGLDLANAAEAALKIKECANIEAEAFPLHEFMHGPIGMVSKDSALLIFEPENVSNQDILKKVISVAKEAGAESVLIGGTENHTADIHLPVAELKSLSIFPELIPVQLIAYYLAIFRSLDPDKPKGLAKVVE